MPEECIFKILAVHIFSMPSDIVPLLGFGAFSAFFLIIMFIGLIEAVGKFYGTLRVLVRDDLSGEQRIIWLVVIWFIPVGWAIYFLLGTKKTADLFNEVDFL